MRPTVSNRNLGSMATHFLTLLASCLSLEYFLYKSTLSASSTLALTFWSTLSVVCSIAVFPIMFVCFQGLAYTFYFH